MSSDGTLDFFRTKSHNPSFQTIRSSTAFKGELIDFCVPVNAYFPPPEMLAMIQENLGDILKYYPDYADVHQEYVADLTGVPAERVVVGNGSTEIITLLCRDAEGPMVTSVPTFGRWTDLPADFRVPVRFIQRDKAKDFRLGADEVVARVREVGARTLVLSNPNNPTGAWFTSAEVRRVLRELADLALVVIDESFIDFGDLESAAHLVADVPNLVVVKSMGKALGWHGIRLGYAVADPRRARELRAKVPYWNINGLAAFVLKNVAGFRDLYAASFGKVARERDRMSACLQEIEGLRVYPSKANFLYVGLPAGVSGRRLRDVLLEDHGLIVRECGNKVGSTEGYLRLAVKRESATDKLVRALAVTLPDLAGSS